MLVWFTLHRYIIWKWPWTLRWDISTKLHCLYVWALTSSSQLLCTVVRYHSCLSAEIELKRINIWVFFNVLIYNFPLFIPKLVFFLRTYISIPSCQKMVIIRLGTISWFRIISFDRKASIYFWVGCIYMNFTHMYHVNNESYRCVSYIPILCALWVQRLSLLQFILFITNY